jgi:hypothetical protein
MANAVSLAAASLVKTQWAGAANAWSQRKRQRQFMFVWGIVRHPEGFLMALRHASRLSSAPHMGRAPALDGAECILGHSNGALLDPS